MGFSWFKNELPYIVFHTHSDGHITLLARREWMKAEVMLNRALHSRRQQTGGTMESSAGLHSEADKV